MEDLKQCPFCGSKKLQIKDGYMPDRKILYSVFCFNCGGNGTWAVTKELAIDAWNRREG